MASNPFDHRYMNTDFQNLYPSIINPHILIKDDIKDEDLSKTDNKNDDLDEWVWIRGYKGTDANMCCRDFQYELNKVYEMDDDVVICNKGYHLCMDLKSVFGYYSIERGNRFFEVSALVQKRLVKKVDMINSSPSLFSRSIFANDGDKLVAKSIIFLREVSVDEVFAALDDEECNTWSEADKNEAMRIGRTKVKNRVRTKKLIDLGYNDIFAAWVVRDGRFDVAYAVGHQPGLSMEMKCLAIFAGSDD